MMSLTPEAIIVGLNLFATTGVWLRLGSIVERSAENRKRIVRLENAIFTHE